MQNYNSKKYFEILDKYFRGANYLSVAQLYLKDNIMLERPLEREDVKRKIVGHWGTVPGQNFVYAHLSRTITKYDLNMILISGPGHGGNFFLSNCYLEGRYSEVYPDIDFSKEGMKKFCKQFSFPCGVSSHVAPETPGSMHEGGELGYSLLHGFGAVLDNPDLIATVIVGDGESETGPLATSWHSNKFINPLTDGVVLPILHLNGYKISNPTVLSRIPKSELKKLLEGYGWHPYFVEGDQPMLMHKKMAKVMDKCINSIKNIKKRAKNSEFNDKRPIYPMIVLRTPKGWTGPKEVDSKQIEGTFRAHQVPISMEKEEHLTMLENWLKSYKPEEIFDGYKLKDEIRAILPKGDRRLSANPVTNGGLLLKDLKLPDFRDYKVDVPSPGAVKAQDMLVLSRYIRDIFKLNSENKNYRVFSPDEAMSNRLYSMFDYEKRDFNAKILPNDENLSHNGRIMDSYLSEHACEGWLEGYLLTGRHGVFASYEAFIRIVDSMVSQHAKWLKVCKELPWRKPISSLNFLLTSNVWQQDHNGYTHQEPGFLDHIANKKSEIVRIYLPPDANCLLSCYDHCQASKNYINAIVASKHPSYQWLNMDEAVKHCTKGIGVWKWACLNDYDNPDIVLASAGDTPTVETLACVSLIKKYLPKLNVRFVNVVDIMKLENNSLHPHGLTDSEFDKLFTKDKPVIFNFHGYPKFIHDMIIFRHNRNIDVHGYKEEGTITTAFDMRVQNEIDRYHLLLSVLESLKLTKKYKDLVENINKTLENHKKYIAEYGVDMPEVADWKWK